MNEKILNKFLNNEIKCKNCNTIINIIYPNKYLNKKHSCKCQSITVYVSFDKIMSYFSFSNDNVGYDIQYNFNENYSEVYIDRIKQNFKLYNFCPFEHNIGHIVDTISAKLLFQ